jgi:hypothetical protein
MFRALSVGYSVGVPEHCDTNLSFVGIRNVSLVVCRNVLKLVRLVNYYRLLVSRPSLCFHCVRIGRHGMWHCCRGRSVQQSLYCSDIERGGMPFLYIILINSECILVLDLIVGYDYFGGWLFWVFDTFLNTFPWGFVRDSLRMRATDPAAVYQPWWKGNSSYIISNMLKKYYYDNHNWLLEFYDLLLMLWKSREYDFWKIRQKQ